MEADHDQNPSANTTTNLTTTITGTTSDHTTITPTERIRELDDIDASIAKLLRAAGEALDVLGSAPPPDLAAAKSQFLDSITTYFRLVSSVDVRLRRQVYALEEAGLIGKGDAKDAKKGASGASGTSGTGAGAVDLGWLVGSGDQVERDMEREIWRKAREFVENLAGNADQSRVNGHQDTGAIQDREGSIMDQDDGASKEHHPISSSNTR